MAQRTGKKWFAAALQHHQSGRLAEAEALYRRLLAHDPHHADSLHLLGVVALQTGRPSDAVRFIGQAIASNDKIAAYHSNFGLALTELGRLDEALASHQRALARQPNYPEALCNLGMVLAKLRRPDEAMAAYRQSLTLEAKQPQTLYNLASLLAEQGQLQAAARCYRQALALRPNYFEAYNNLGIVLGHLGQTAEAAACYREAIALRPDHPNAYSNLGTALMEQGQSEPDPDRVRNGQMACDSEQSCESVRRTIGGAASSGREHWSAANARQMAVPGAFPVRLSDQAVACYQQALALAPNHAEAHYNLGRALLARGDFSAGWQEFEWRWQTQALLSARRLFQQPQWSGGLGGGRTLLIHAEQGYGDTLQFCRYASLAADSGWRVIMEVPKALVGVLSTLRGVACVVAHGERLPVFDQHCPMLSLPLAFGTTLASIPSAVPYLQANDQQAASWGAQIDATASSGATQDLRMGLVWAGNPRRDAPALAAIDRRRSLDPILLAPLFDIPGWLVFSLQKSGPPAPAHFPIIDMMSKIADFADTAALISHLDLVISVDTSVAHLAAALGKPVWLLDRFDPCWRWLSGRRDSPWYPTLRIYRQPRPGDWRSVVAEVAEDLRRLRIDSRSAQYALDCSGP
jgi:tetratricopeptide (TPR) repeat protein